MPTPTSHQAEVNRAVRARTLLEDELLAEAFALLRQTYLDAWMSSPARDTEGRESIWYFVQALDAVRGHLQSVVETGRMAEAQLAALRKHPSA